MSGRSGARRLGVGSALVDGVLVPGDVEVTDGAVSAVGLHPGRDALLALPGLVDLQVNGFAGIDLLAADVAGFGHAAEALARTGVTTYQPTFVSAPPEATAAALATLARVRAQPQNGARALAAHLEGPFISPVRCGAHDARHITAPSIAAADALCGSGPVGMMTLAPEIDGALAVIAHLRRRGVVVSLGHSDATSSIAGAAFDSGATAVTHILNAMRPITAREPGLAGVAMTRTDVAVMAIIDGVHLAAETVSILVGAVRGRLCLVTDAIAAAGEGDGDFRLGGRPVHVTGREVRLDDGTLAGSVLTMNAALRNLVAHGIGIDEAVDAATRVPAGVIGDVAAGRLHVGSRADIAVVDGAFEVHRTLVGGAEVYAR